MRTTVRAAIGHGAMLAMAAWTAGCSGAGGSAGTCALFAACGGDVTGTWTIRSACFGNDVTGGDDSCPTMTVDTTGLTVSGTMTYNGDMTYAASRTIGGSMSATFPASCLSMGGVTLTCEQIGASLMTSLAKGGDSPFDMASCSGSSSCRCTLHYRPQTQTENGTYSTADNVITTKKDGGGTTTTTPYCVKGNELDVAATTMSSGSGAGGTMPAMTTTSYIIATK